MKEYLIKYYLDDIEENPFKDCEIDIIKAYNKKDGQLNLADYLTSEINNNPFNNYKVYNYVINDNNITFGIYNFKTHKGYLEKYKIEIIEESEVKL